MELKCFSKEEGEWNDFSKILLRQDKELLVEKNFYMEGNELARSLLSQDKNLWWRKSL